MAVITAEPTGTTAPDNWSLGAGASKVAAVALPHDDASSYLASGGSSSTYQTFTLTPALSAGDTITQIVLKCRAKRALGSDVNFRVGYTFTPQGGGSQTGESDLNALTAAANWDDFTWTFSGLSAVWGSGMQIWIRNTQTRNMHLTTFNAEITYTPVPGAGGVPVKRYYYHQLAG